MKKLIAAVVLILCLTPYQTAMEENSSPIVLPNPKLLRCGSSDCFSLWLEKSPDANGIFPKQFIIDMNQNCLYGFTVLYDKSIAFGDVRAAINEHYGKWAVAGFKDSATMGLWRVEPEKFAIQLSVAGKKDEKMNIAEAGTKQVIYLAFGTRCTGP